MTPVKVFAVALTGALLIGFASAGWGQTARTATSGVTKLTEPQDDYPDVSPDGETILFQSNRSGTWQLWQMGADGTGLRRVSEGEFNDRQPDWSPDGRTVAFSTDRGLTDGRRAIYVMDWPKRYAPRRLSAATGQDVHPKWLPDGSGIVFNRISGDGRQADIHVVTLDGRERKIDLGPGLNTYASVDRTGKRLVYRGTTRETGPSGPVDNSDIFVAGADGSAKRRLTTGPAFDGWPAVSPDGSAIAFASRQGGDRFRLFLMPLEGGEMREVPAPSGYNYTQPTWSPDGQSLVVYRWMADSAGEFGQIVRVALP